MYIYVYVYVQIFSLNFLSKHNNSSTLYWRIWHIISWQLQWWDNRKEDSYSWSFSLVGETSYEALYFF